MHPARWCDSLLERLAKFAIEEPFQGAAASVKLPPLASSRSMRSRD